MVGGGAGSVPRPTWSSPSTGRISPATATRTPPVRPWVPCRSCAYTRPAAFRTAGTLDEGGDILELVSLPALLRAQAAASFTWNFRPRWAPPWSARCEALEDSSYESTEQTVSRFLPNLEAYRSLLAIRPRCLRSLKARLDRQPERGLAAPAHPARTPTAAGAGGRRGESDPYITTYVLFGMSRTRQAGISINLEMVRKAIGYYLQKACPSREPPGGPDLAADRLVFQHFVLAQLGAGRPNPDREPLSRGEHRLSPWAQALLALTLEDLSPGSAEARTSSRTWAPRPCARPPVRTGSSARIRGRTATPPSAICTPRSPTAPWWSTPWRGTTPARRLLADALRYLMAHRDARRRLGRPPTPPPGR